jgi:putative phosphoribosyl transferase
MFIDRTDAGYQLAELLGGLASEHPIIYALPRGGVQVAIPVARELGAPLDLLIVRKIGAPGYPEVALGAVIDGDEPQMVVNADVYAATGRDAVGLERARLRELAEIERRRERYLGNRAPLNPAGRTVIIVDDGLATGATARAALAGLRRLGTGKIVLAVPVAPADTIAEMQGEADDIVVVHAPREFWAIGPYYADFHQLSDEETVEMLESLWSES